MYDRSQNCVEEQILREKSVYSAVIEQAGESLEGFFCKFSGFRTGRVAGGGIDSVSRGYIIKDCISGK